MDEMEYNNNVTWLLIYKKCTSFGFETDGGKKRLQNLMLNNKKLWMTFVVGTWL